MTDPAAAPARERTSASAGLQLRRLQLVYAGVVALVFVVFSIVHEDVWTHWSSWVAAGAVAVATLLAIVLDGRAAQAPRWLLVVAPLLDLLAVMVLVEDDAVPRVIAVMAVVPAFWLGIAARRWGVAIVAVIGLAAAVLMAREIPESTGVTLTANAMGALLVPLGLVAAAWFADTYARTVDRQQRAILHREREKLALAKEREADAALLDAIFDTVRVGLLLLDADGHIVRTNGTLRNHPAMGGADLGDIVDGARFLELESRRAMPRADTPFVRAARGESFDNLVFWLARPGSDSFAITMSSRPLLLDGEFRGSIASIDDVTGYMRMLEDRDDFVALVSHELRTPLTSIQGYLELTLDEDLPASLRSWLQIVERNAKRLRALVEDLLLVGEMSRGETNLELQRVDLRAIAAESVAALAHRARNRGVGLALADGPPVEVDADPRRIAQVIENFISNGIKYTRDAGTVEVHVETDGADAVLRVVDDGHGMLPTEAARVFERFFRSADARASGVQGAGLGLWICRMIVQSHGGTAAFDSELGRGSTASFRLPAA